MQKSLRQNYSNFYFYKIVAIDIIPIIQRGQKWDHLQVIDVFSLKQFLTHPVFAADTGVTDNTGKEWCSVRLAER